MAKITLTQDKLFEVAGKLAKAYRGSFSPDTISRASTFIEGQSNPSRNLMWGIIMNTQGKSGKLSEVYAKKTAESLVKLTIYKLNQPEASSQTVDAF